MKSVFLLCILFMLVGAGSAGVLALSIEMKEEHAPGETLIANISGNVLEQITKDQVEFRRGHVAVSSFEYDIKKLGDAVYLWALVPSDLGLRGNYTLALKSIATTVNGIQQKVTIEKNFSVAGNVTAYAVKPGFIATREDFDVGVQSYTDKDLTISVDFPIVHDVVLKPGVNVLHFSLVDIASTRLVILRIGQYALPAYLQVNDTKTPGISLSSPLQFQPSSITKTFFIDENPVIVFSVENSGKQSFEKLSFLYNREVMSVTPDSRLKMLPGERFSFNVTLKQRKSIRESIVLKGENVSIELPIRVDIVERVVENTTAAGYRCNEIPGKICAAREVCKGELVVALDGSCCIGVCALEKKQSKAWIGYLLAGLVLLGAVVVYLRTTRVKTEKNPLQTKIKELEKKIP